jgi:hypothetical protein
MAMDNSLPKMIEESERPPLSSGSQKAPLGELKKRTIHLLQNRTFLFALDMGAVCP